MSSKQTNPILKAWYQWKSLRLPWRKRFFVGRDPQGNTYYELRQPRGDAPENAPCRRLVHYPRSTPYSEVKVPPAWHQWLRHQRMEAPTMAEQVAELQRQARMKLLAAEADARWEAKPSLLDMPPTKTAPPTTTTAKSAPAPAPAPAPAATSPPLSMSERVSGNGDQAQRVTVEDGAKTRGEVREVADTEPRGAKTSQTKAETNTDPWKRAQRGAPGETWQPQAWTPTSAPARKR
ncbi:hypothetical protein F5Y09DRAFT_243948 [Xylaria sp. FL1042]|nr:hypothetical protein F5Y09DRAFT_243948 [Xylaria sp. FL1042]